MTTIEAFEASVGGLRLNYYVTGAGEPLLVQIPLNNPQITQIMQIVNIKSA